MQPDDRLALAAALERLVDDQKLRKSAQLQQSMQLRSLRRVSRQKSRASGDRSSMLGSDRSGNAIGVTFDAGIDHCHLLTRRTYRLSQPVFQADLGAKPELSISLSCAAEAMPRAVPLPRGPGQHRRAGAGEPDDLLCQLADRGLDAAREVVDVAGIAPRSAHAISPATMSST